MTGPAAPGKDACAVAGALCIYSRADDTAIRFIADGSPVPEAERLLDVAFCADREEAAAIAAACAEILARTPGAAADESGWHTLPPGARLATMLPTPLAAARNAAWATPWASPGPSEPLSAVTPPERAERQSWTPERIDWLGYLVGQGMTAKQIAADSIIDSTPGAVQRAANKFGLYLSAAPRGTVSCRLPIDAVVVLDRAAATVHQTRAAFLRRWMIRATRDPAWYGIVVVAAG